jgi:hypothetical protein
MPGKTASRVTFASACALIVGGALAIPASAQAGPVGPKQFYDGQVFGIASATTQDVIGVGCAGPATTGHPLPGQSVAAHQIFPPAATTAGYTGNFGTEIRADLTWSRGTITVVTAIGTLTSYDVKVSIPTTITVPCSGSGVMSFTPSPDPDNSGKASDVSVTFQSTGVLSSRLGPPASRPPRPRAAPSGDLAAVGDHGEGVCDDEGAEAPG